MSLAALTASVLLPHWHRWFPPQLLFVVLPVIDWLPPFMIQIIASVLVFAAFATAAVGAAGDLLGMRRASGVLALSALGGCCGEGLLILGTIESWRSQSFTASFGPGFALLVVAAAVLVALPGSAWIAEPARSGARRVKQAREVAFKNWFERWH